MIFLEQFNLSDIKYYVLTPNNSSAVTCAHYITQRTHLNTEDRGAVEDAVENQEPEWHEGDEVVELVRTVHADAQHEGQEIHLEENLQSPLS